MAGALATGMVSLATTAHASTISFLTGEPNGDGVDAGAAGTGSVNNTRQWAANGLTVTVKAYTYGSNFDDAALGLYTGNGLGVCASPTDCNSPWHQVDNKTSEWVLFVFSQAITPTAIGLNTTDGSDTGIKYFWGSGITDLTGPPDKTFADLGGGTVNDPAGNNGDRSAPLVTGVPVTYLLVGANPFLDSHTVSCGTYSYPRTCTVTDYDKFKITGLTYDTPQRDVPVPEPASLLLLGTGLIGAASRLRRRKNQQ